MYSEGKKIWIINHHAMPPSTGGLNRHYYFYKHLTARGYDVTIFTASQIHNTDINMIEGKEAWREVMCDGVPYTFVRTGGYTGNSVRRIANMLEFPWRMGRIHRKFERPDVIYTSSPDMFACVAAVRIARKLGVPCILEVRDLWPESIVIYNNISRKNPVIRLLYALEKWMYRRADRLLFTISAGKDYLTERGLDRVLDMGKVSILPNGIDLEEFARNVENFPATDAHLHDKRFFNIGYTGSMRTVNNILKLVDVAKELRARGNTRCRLLLWGKGSDATALAEAIAREGLLNIVFNGYVQRRDIASIISQCDANLLHWRQSPVMRYGVSANKLFDYFAAGRPIIATMHITRHPVEAYDAGIVSIDDSPEAIADAIERIAALPPESYARYCENARRAAQDFDYSILTDQLEAVIRGVLPRQCPSPSARDEGGPQCNS